MAVFWKDLRDHYGNDVLLTVVKRHGGKRVPIPTLETVLKQFEKEKQIVEAYNRPGANANDIQTELQVKSKELYKAVKRNPDGTLPKRMLETDDEPAPP